jgi:hypothetical protein
VQVREKRSNKQYARKRPSPLAGFLGGLTVGLFDGHATEGGVMTKIEVCKDKQGK